MINFRNLAVSIWGYEPSAPLPYSQDLSMYRGFRFGADLLAVAKQAHVKPSEARMIHERPAVIQELAWLPYKRSSPGADSVKDILFSFYNGELFRIVVTYDSERIAGMTAEDIVEAVSAKYGTATKPIAEIILSSTQFYHDGGEKIISDRTEKIIACWEDSHHSFNLFQPSYQPTFGMIMYSKRLDALARAAIVESVRLDKQEAPRRENERQKKNDEERRGRQEKARQANKESFRP
jgi:hypothetical protein